jgi:hypothetical protein
MPPTVTPKTKTSSINSIPTETTTAAETSGHVPLGVDHGTAGRTHYSMLRGMALMEL